MSDEYPSNAHNPPAKQRPAREKQPVIVTGVQVRKQPWGVRISQRGKTILQDVLFEVIRPYFRDMFADSGYAAIDRVFYNDNIGRGPSRRPGSRPSQQTQQMTPAGYIVTDYSSQYASGGAPAPQQQFDPGAGRYDFSRFTFPNYANGRELIDRLTHIIHGAGHATVNDLLDMFGQSYDHTGENWGWEGLESLQGAEVRRVRGGGAYYLDIPDARPLKK